MASALGLIPAASCVLVDVAIRGRILIAIRGLARSRVVTVGARCGNTFATGRCLHGPHRAGRCGLMLRVCGIAILGDN